MVWQQQNSSGAIDAYFAWSVNGGAGTVENEMMLNLSMAGDQRNPDVAYYNGVFHLVYQNDATGRVVYKTGAFDLSSIGENYQAGYLSIFPNPSTGIFTVSAEQDLIQNATIEVYNMVGEKVLNQHISGTADPVIDLSGRPAGFYFVKIVTGTNVFTQKVVIR